MLKFTNSLRAFKSPGFRLLITAILVTEIVTVAIAGLLLNRGISNQVTESAQRLSAISLAVANSTDWADLQPVLNAKGKSTPAFRHVQKQLNEINHRIFGHNNAGSAIYIAVVRKKRELAIDPWGTHPLYDSGPTNPWERDAFAAGHSTMIPSPYTDEFSTYLAAYTPIFSHGKVIALLAVWRDSPTLDELRTVVRRTFLYAVIPAAIVAIIAALILSARLMEPLEVLREIASPLAEEPTKDAPRPLDRLSPKEREVAELAAKGMTNPEIASALTISPETVKHHLKSIKIKTGLSRFDLAKSIWHAHLT